MANINTRVENGTAINPSNYELCDADTGESLGQDDLGCSAEDYADAVRSSVRTSDSDSDGEVLCNGRIVRAIHV